MSLMQSMLCFVGPSVFGFIGRSRVVRILRVGIVIAIASACMSCETGATTKLSGSRQSNAKVDWLASCGTATEMLDFSLRIEEDGTVHYVGGALAREVGDRSVPISDRALTQLQGAVDEFLTVSTRTGISRDASQSGSSSTCMRVSASRGRRVRTEFAWSGDPNAIRFEKKIRDAVAVSTFVCPPRQTKSAADTPSWKSLVNYCPNTTEIWLSIREPTTCYSTHNVVVHTDGTVYYFGDARPIGEDGRRRWAVVDDQYFKLTDRKLDAIHALLRDLNLPEQPDSIVDIPLRKPSVPQQQRGYTSGKPEDVEALRQLVNSLINIHWAKFGPDEKPCASESVGSHVDVHAGYPWS